MTHEQIQEIPLDRIQADNIRDRTNPEEFNGLIESLKLTGQLYPIRLRPTLDDLLFIVDGHRRVEGLRALGKSMVLAIVESQPLEEAESIQKALIANVQREDLSPLAKARAFARLMEALQLNVSETAARVGMRPSYMTKLLSYLKLSESLAERLSAKGAGPSVVYQLARFEDPQEQAAQAEKFLGGQLTRDALGGKVRRRKGPAAPGKPDTVARFTAPLGKGKSVTVSCSSQGGIDEVIAILEELLQRARRARAKGHSATTFSKTLRDEARSRAGVTASQKEDNHS